MNDSGEGALSRSGGILAANVTNFLFDDLDYNGSLIHNTTEGNETVKAKASHYDFYRVSRFKQQLSRFKGVWYTRSP